MPPYKPGGHEQGLKKTLNVAVDPHQRDKVEEEAANRKKQAWANHGLSDVVRDALDQYFSGDLDRADELLSAANHILRYTGLKQAESLITSIEEFLAR